MTLGANIIPDTIVGIAISAKLISMTLTMPVMEETAPMVILAI